MRRMLLIRRIVLPAVAIAAVLGTVSGVSAGRAGVTLADVREATVKYQNLSLTNGPPIWPSISRYEEKYSAPS